MMIKSRKKRIITEFVFIIAAIAAVLFFGKECSDGAVKGIYYCLNVLVPSIFPFMVIAVFTAESGVSQKLGKVTCGLCERLFGVSGKLSAVIIMSMIGGYPVGARGISALRNSGEISSDEAAKAAYFAVGAGPGFLVTFVGTNLLSCPEVGFCMLAAQILSVIILGVMNKLLFGKNNSYNSNKEIYNSSTSFTSALTEAVISATYGMLEMCGMVVIFSAIISVTERLSGDMRVYLSILLEVTTACNTLSENNSVLLIAFAVGFGGLCVHFQIFTALKNVNFNKGLFFLFRIMQGLITALLTELFIKLFRISLPVFSSVDNTPELSLSSSVIGSAMLIICGVGFLFNIKKLGGKYVRNSRVNRQV